MAEDPLAVLKAAAQSRSAAKIPSAKPRARVPVAKPIGPAGKPAKRKLPLAVWIAAAALLLIIIGGITLAFMLMSSKAEDQTAKQKNAQKAPLADGPEALFPKVKPK